MTDINREDIYIISRNSNWSEKGIDKVFKERIYSGATSWHKFLRILFISLGIGFITAGIGFFFAYNWADLNKFAKLGLIEGLIVVLTLIVLFSKLNLSIKNIILTSASVMVGVLFAVFGQIYQTGANAYDFFLGWTLFVTLWVIIADYAPLWLLYFVLINTTFVLYSQQVAQHWSENFIITLLVIMNALFLVFSKAELKIIDKVKSPVWFSNILALTILFFATIGIAIGIFDDYTTNFFILILITGVLYFIGIKHGLKSKSVFYLSIIPFSLIIILSALFIKISDEASMYFIISLFVIVGVTFTIKKILDIQKRWRND